MKKLLLITSTISLLLFLVAMYPVQTGVCSVEARSCWNLADRIQPYFGIIASLLPLCLITFWMKEEVFLAWLKVAFWAIPVVIVATLWADAQHPFFMGMQYIVPVLIALIAFSIALSHSLVIWFLVYKKKHLKFWIPYTIFYSLVIVVYIIGLL